MSERNERSNDPWTQLGEELGEYLLQSFRSEVQKETQDTPADSEDTIEALAAHCQYRHHLAMQHILSLCEQNFDGSMTIPADACWRWLHDANRYYPQLPQAVQDVRREEARAILKLLEGEGG